MNFITFEFFIFLIFFFIIYFLSPQKLQKYVLLGFNFIYISYYKKTFLIFIVFVSTVCYFFGISLNKKIKEKKIINIIFWSILVFLVSLLGYLKFFPAFISYINIKNMNIISKVNNIYLPLGISFYTLQGISYIVDVYKEKYPPERNYLLFLLYMTFFPIFLQGPISRYNQLSLELKKETKFNYYNFCYGIQLIFWGIFKKLVISNRMNIITDEIFNNYSKYSGIIILIGGMSYALELYTDFSGAVDITRGIAQSINIKVINNFNFPNSSISIKDFWSRWHLSLSNWLRDYVYIPLGGNRKGKIRKYFNILLTFVVSGLWHGVGMQFVIWGIIHALYQILAELLENIIINIKQHLKYKEILSIICDNNSLEMTISKIMTFILVSIAWIFFRAPDLKTAYEMLKKLNYQFFEIGNFLNFIKLDNKDFLVLLVSLVIFYIAERASQRFSVRKNIGAIFLPFRWLFYILFIHWIILFGVYGNGYNPSNFIYMGF